MYCIYVAPPSYYTSASLNIPLNLALFVLESIFYSLTIDLLRIQQAAIGTKKAPNDLLWGSKIKMYSISCNVKMDSCSTCHVFFVGNNLLKYYVGNTNYERICLPEMYFLSLPCLPNDIVAKIP